jgi:ribulose-5-phosphate 4-epimerase/fuculose-1-phosphate aldolase
MSKKDGGSKGLKISRDEFCRYCHLLYDRDLVTGVGGNLSVRIQSGIYITPSGFSLREVSPEKVVRIDLGGEVLEGGIPTSDKILHLNILNERSDVNVVCHTHGAFIVAASCILDPGPSSLPPLTPGFVYFSYPLPLIPFCVPGSQDLARAAVEKIRTSDCSAVLLQNHGLVTLGSDFSEALNIAEEIDEAAKIFVLTHGKARHIPEEDIERIKAYGKSILPKNDAG